LIRSGAVKLGMVSVPASSFFSAFDDFAPAIAFGNGGRKIHLLLLSFLLHWLQTRLLRKRFGLDIVLFLFYSPLSCF